MRPTFPVILRNAKNPSARPPALIPWILRGVQHDIGRVFFGLLLALGSLLSAPSAKATELIDLGLGLSYLRIHSIADSEAALRKIVPGTTALVLDLRQATASGESAAVLQSALADRPANSPIFILVGPATPPAIARIIDSRLTLGAPGSSPAPKVVVQTDAATDRRAYDALDAGTPVAALISGKIEKERFDEATLVQEFKNGNHDAEPPPGPDPAAPKTGAAGEKPAPLIDQVLQRAVHLHQALLSLKAR